MSLHPNSLWDFACALYSRPKVAPLCLRLQDDYSLNVNLVLWCVWLDTQGLALTESRLQQAQQLIADWESHYTQPLRDLRRQLKSQNIDADSFALEIYGQLKQAELLAERKTLSMLESLARDESAHATNSCRNQVGALANNLDVYLARAKLPSSLQKEVLEYLC